MYRLKNLFMLITLTYSCNLLAQTDFSEVENTTYNQYINKQWKPLIKYGRNESKKGYDEYYFNMRVGIAYYTKLNYIKASKFFNKALKNDGSSDVAKEYLFYSDLFSTNERAADDTYRTLSDSVKSRIKYKIKRPLESIYVEGGIKISDNTKVANHLGYAQIGINHKISSLASLYYAYTFQMQKQIWGHYSQHQFFIEPSFHFKKNLTLNVGFHYSNYSSVIDFKDYIFEHSPPPANPTGPFMEQIVAKHITKTGTYKENLLLTQVSVAKTIKGFTIAPHAGLFINFSNTNYIDSHRDTIIIRNHNGPTIVDSNLVINAGDSIFNVKEMKFEGLFGAALYYNFGRFMIGADVTVILNKKVKTAIVTPYIRATIAKRFAVSAYFMYKGSYPLALFDGAQLYNSLDKIKYKTSITGEIYATKKLNLYLTYQFEGITDSFSSQNYNLHTILTGLKFNL